ncbi:MAG: YmfQ family protein [Paenibacillaceae bacterium]|nr:YmfQ family protein [Paenibacillaceae bacterium]
MVRNIQNEMMDDLPDYYMPRGANGKPGLVGNLITREAQELVDLNAEIREVLDQFFIDRATWGLATWEAICGIPIDEGKPQEQRRSVIKSKIRGAGTVTLAVIKEVADSFENGEIQVQENFNKYEVVITFIGKRGVPPNLPDMQNALREIVPAHLQLVFQFTYLRWEELDAAELTWEKLDALDMSWDELEVWKPGAKRS